MIRVYEMPIEVGPVGFLHTGGVPVAFLHVDWFDEPEDSTFSAADLKEFLAEKRYRRPGRRYLVASDERPDLTFVLEPQT